MDDYFAGLDEGARGTFEHIRALVTDLLPDVEQGKSYGLAALTYRHKPLLGFLAAQHHLSIFPFSPAAVDAVRDRLAAFKVSKGTIRFTVANPLPDDVVRDIVRYRSEEIVGAADVPRQ